GDRIALTTHVGPDNDAHMYEPRPADVTAVKDADVVLANGAHFEGFLERLVQASGSTANVVELTKGINLLRSTGDDHHHHEGHGHDDDHAESHGHDHGEYDPHAWQSVHNARIYVNNIVQAFCNADQGGCPSYRANAESYGKKLEALQKELEAMVQQIPSDKRTVIASHDAFAYLGHEYGFQFLAPQGTSTGSEASAGDVAKLIQQIKQQK